MGLSIASNTPTISLVSNLYSINRRLDTSTTRLSSGYRINTSGDDPAGYAISENLSALISSAGQATRNTNDGISLVSVADDASREVVDILKRIREIAVQGSSATLSSSDRSNLETEMTELVSEVGRLASNTEFNDIQLTDGTKSTLDIQVGVNGTSSDRITVTLGDLSTSTIGVDVLDVSTTAASATTIDQVDIALDSVNGYRAQYGASQNRLESAVDYMDSYGQNLNVTRSHIRDVDFASETAERSKLLLLQKSSLAVLAQQLNAQENLLALL